MLDKLKAVEDRYNEMAERAAQPDFYADPQAAAKLLREQRQLEPIVSAYRRYVKTAQEAKDLREMLDGQLDEAWILETEAGEPAAYANFRFLSGEGELMRIAVLPEYRGRGYSRKLMERLEESARAAGAQELTLEVRESNEAALHLYKSCGFRVEAVRKDYYRNPKENALILWKRGFLGIPT